MDVARAPMGYRDVPSGRASVAGEFVRVARLCRARMSGQAFLVTSLAFERSDSPEGAKQDGRANSERRRNTQAKATGLFPFGPAQALFAMEPRPAFVGMVGLSCGVRKEGTRADNKKGCRSSLFRIPAKLTCERRARRNRAGCGRCTAGAGGRSCTGRRAFPASARSSPRYAPGRRSR